MSKRSKKKFINLVNNVKITVLINYIKELINTLFNQKTEKENDHRRGLTFPDGGRQRKLQHDFRELEAQCNGFRDAANTHHGLAQDLIQIEET